MSEWKNITLKKIVDSANTGLDAIKRAPIVLENTGKKCLRIQDISQQKSFENWGYTNVEQKNFERFQLREGDIIIARTGNTIGVNRYFDQDYPAVFNNGLIRLRVNSNEASSKYVYYNLRTKYFKDFIESISGGTSTQPNMQIEVLLTLDLLLPPLTEQQAIAEVLSSLDDKIDLLHRNNKTLEEMAETLFRQWFVEGAKEDWEDSSLLDCINLIGGGTPKTSNFEYWNGDIPWLSCGDIAKCHKSFITNSEKSITKNGLTNSSAKLLPKFSTVITARGTVGKYSLLSKPMAFSQSNYGVLPKIEGSSFYTYLLVANSVEALNSSSYGSVFDTITTSTFQGVTVQQPPSIVVLKFEKLVTPVFEKILNNSNHIQGLIKVRDSLLPKLMSGQVRVQA